MLKLTDVYGNPAYSAIEDSLKGKSGIFPEWVFLETKTGKTAIAGAVSLYTESGLRNLSVIFMDATKAYTDDQAKDEEIRGLRDELSVLRQELKNSFPFIGRRFNGKDHTTAIHSYKKIEIHQN